LVGETEGPQPDLGATTRAVFNRQWRPEGYTCPNADRYPWQWLWDSAFHAIVWAELGDDRATTELETLLSGQDPETGFVPHVGYQRDPTYLAEFWGRVGWSSITQPPMFGHAVAELIARGVPVSEETIDRAVAGVRFLTRSRRRSRGGLVELVHPWESGADDSLRWDDVMGGPEVSRAARFERKGALLAAVERGPSGAPLANDDFAIGVASMTALVAFNAAELASVTGDGGLADDAEQFAGALADRWDSGVVTWTDEPLTSGPGSHRARSLEALTGALVDPTEAHVDGALDQLIDPNAHGAPFGPTGVHRAEPAYSPTTYWRGPAWPQLTYLLWVAARRRGRSDVADGLRTAVVRGASASGFAEYWHPDTGVGSGAVPQSWTGLAYVVDQA
jgi:hypothetical protein